MPFGTTAPDVYQLAQNANRGRMNTDGPSDKLSALNDLAFPSVCSASPEGIANAFIRATLGISPSGMEQC